MAVPRQIAVSYASAQENAAASSGTVERFRSELEAAGVTVTIASKDLHPGDSINKFMAEKIGKADYLCVFLSKGYLQSAYCMYELLVAWKYNADNADAFRKRVRRFSFLDGNSISTSGGRVVWVDYWKGKAEASREALNEMGNGAGPASLQETKWLEEISQSVDQMLADASSGQIFADEDQFLQFVKTDLGIVSSIPGTAAPAPAIEAFPHVIEQIDSEFAQNQTVLQFCRRHLAHYLRGSKLRHDIVREFQNDPAAFANALEAIESDLEQNVPKEQTFRTCLQNVLAGLLVLSISPEWVQIHRHQSFRSPTPIPGRKKFGSLGVDSRDGKRIEYDWLQMSIAALMDSRPRLERVFCRPQESPRRIPAPPLVGESMGTTYEGTEVKQHFIRCILQEFPEVPQTEIEREQFETTYAEVLTLLKRARERRDPYHLDPDGNSAVAGRVEALRLKDLLLFADPQRDPGAFLPEHIRKLGSLYNLFDLLNI